MNFPIQINYDLSKQQTDAVYGEIEGRKDKRNIIVISCLFGLVFFIAAINIFSEYVGACSYVNSRIDYSTFDMAKMSMKNVYICLAVMGGSIVTAFLFIWLTLHQAKQWKQIYYDKYHKGIVVLGKESYLNRNINGEEKQELYKDLFEARENDEFIILMPWDHSRIPIAKNQLTREQFVELSKLISTQMGEFYIKYGRKNILDVRSQTLFGTRDKRFAKKKRGNK